MLANLLANISDLFYRFIFGPAHKNKRRYAAKRFDLKFWYIRLPITFILAFDIYFCYRLKPVFYWLVIVWAVFFLFNIITHKSFAYLRIFGRLTSRLRRKGDFEYQRLRGTIIYVGCLLFATLFVTFGTGVITEFFILYVVFLFVYPLLPSRFNFVIISAFSIILYSGALALNYALFDHQTIPFLSPEGISLWFFRAFIIFFSGMMICVLKKPERDYKDYTASLLKLRKASEEEAPNVGNDIYSLSRAVLENAMLVTRSDVGTFHIFDDTASELQINTGLEYNANKGEFDEWSEEKRGKFARDYKSKKGITYEVFNQGIPILCNCVKTGYCAKKYASWRDKTRSELAVPIFDDSGNTIGVLNVESFHRSNYRVHDQKILEMLAAQAGPLLRSVKLLSAKEKTSGFWLRLFTAVGTSGDRVDLTEKVIKEINERFDSDFTAFWIYEAKDDILILKEVWPETTRSRLFNSGARKVLPVEGSVIGNAITDGKPVKGNLSESKFPGWRRFAEDCGYSNILAIPIRSFTSPENTEELSSDSEGPTCSMWSAVLAIHPRAGTPFEVKSKSLSTTEEIGNVAYFLGLAMDYVRLAERQVILDFAASALKGIDAGLFEPRDLQKKGVWNVGGEEHGLLMFVTEFVRLVVEELGFYYCGVVLTDRRGGYDTIYWRDDEGAGIKKRELPDELVNPLLYEISGRPPNIKHLRNTEATNVKVFYENMVYAIPITKLDETIGAIVCQDDIKTTSRVGYLTNDDIALLEFVANIISYLYQSFTNADDWAEFLTFVRHEMKNPLKLVQEQNRRLKHMLSGKIEKYKIDAKIRDIDLFLQIMTKTLDGHRVIYEYVRMNKEPTEIGKLIDDIMFTANLLKPYYRSEGGDHPGIEKTLNFEISNEVIDLDPVWITVAFYNLLINAYKYSEERGRSFLYEPIYIGSKRLWEYIYVDEDKGKKEAIEELNGNESYEKSYRTDLLITVSSTSIRILDEERDKIFMPRGRGSNAGEKDPNGSGLGLAIVKRVLDEHEIHIELTNTYDPVTFTITIPQHLIKYRS